MCFLCDQSNSHGNNILQDQQSHAEQVPDALQHAHPAVNMGTILTLSPLATTQRVRADRIIAAHDPAHQLFCPALLYCEAVMLKTAETEAILFLRQR